MKKIKIYPNVEKKKTIVLINPHPLKDREYIGVPLQLLAISSLIYKNYNIKIFAERTKKGDNKEKIFNEIKNNKNILCVGVTMMTGYQIKNALNIINKIKEINPEIKIVVGGYHPSILPEQTLNHKNIDIVCIGQGTKTFKELVEALDKSISLEIVNGIYFKNKKEEIIKNPQREFEDVNNFPSMPYHLINVEEYLQEMSLPKGKRVITYISSYSCPFSCKFCVEPLLYNRKYFALKPEIVVDDIERLVKNYKIDAIEFADSNFFVNQERVKRICELIIEKKININFGSCNGRVEQLLNFDEETWYLLQKAGCQSILVGAESGSQEKLDLIGKGIKVEQIEELAKVSKKHNITLVYSFMAGFPIPSKLMEKEREKILMEELNQTLDLINKLIEIKDDDFIFLFLYMPFPKNELFNLAVECGFKAPSRLEDWDYSVNEWNTEWTTPKFRKLVLILHDFYFPYASSKYAERHIQKFGFIQKIFHKIAKWRLKNRYFSFPFEYKLFRYYINLRASKQLK